jgi:hypothetical protein
MDKLPEEMSRSEKLWYIRNLAAKGEYKAAQKFYMNNSKGISLRSYFKAIGECY